MSDIDLFEEYNKQPPDLSKICDTYLTKLENGEEDSYKVCEEFLASVEEIGYTFEYGLDGSPHGLKKADIQKKRKLKLS
jgi:hypothetical protein